MKINDVDILTLYQIRSIPKILEHRYEECNVYIPIIIKSDQYPHKNCPYSLK